MKTAAIAVLIAACLAIGFVVGHRWTPPPPVAAPSHEEKKEESGTIQLTPQQIKNAGIEVQPVPVAAAKETVEVGGIVEADPSRAVKIAARASGRIVSLQAAVGQRVEAEQVVAVIDSPDVADRRTRVRSAAARVEVARSRLARERDVAAASAQNVTPPVEARLRRDRARADAERSQRAWQRAQKLYPDIISRTEYEAARADYRRAQAELRTSEQVLTVEERAARSGVRVRGEIANAVTEVQTAEAELSSARDALEALGVGDGPRGEISVSSPLSGTVATRPVNVGEWVDAHATLFTVVDLSRVWAQIDLYEQDMQRVKVGDEVTLSSGAYPDRKFQGRLSYVSPMLEEHARTAKGRVELINAGTLLRGGMFVKGRVVVGKRVGVPTIPHDAVMADGDQSYVYVEEAEGKFVRRPVVLGTSSEESYEIRKGLRAGERIVTRGAFYLKSEQQREQIGGDD